MKKLIFFIIITIINPVSAQEQTQLELTWTNPTTYTDGQTLPASNILRTNIYTRDWTWELTPWEYVGSTVAGEEYFFTPYYNNTDLRCFAGETVVLSGTSVKSEEFCTGVGCHQ